MSTRWYHISWKSRSFLLSPPAHSIVCCRISLIDTGIHSAFMSLRVSHHPGKLLSQINPVTHLSGFPEMLVSVYWMTRLYNTGGSNCSSVYAPVTAMSCFAFHESQVLQPTQSLVGWIIFQKQIPKTFDVKDSFTSCIPDGPAYLTKRPQIHSDGIKKCLGTHGLYVSQ